MMTTLHSYLTFNGNCKEAMQFYQSCLGGELSMQTIGDSPIAEKMPEMPQRMKEAILHATLKRGAFTLMGTDMVGDKGLIKGNSVALMLNCAHESEMKDYFQKLSIDGVVSQPIEENFWGDLMGDLTDKFGNQWLLHLNK